MPVSKAADFILIPLVGAVHIVCRGNSMMSLW